MVNQYHDPSLSPIATTRREAKNFVITRDTEYTDVSEINLRALLNRNELNRALHIYLLSVFTLQRQKAE